MLHGSATKPVGPSGVRKPPASTVSLNIGTFSFARFQRTRSTMGWYVPRCLIDGGPPIPEPPSNSTHTLTGVFVTRQYDPARERRLVAASNWENMLRVSLSDFLVRLAKSSATGAPHRTFGAVGAKASSLVS